MMRRKASIPIIAVIVFSVALLFPVSPAAAKEKVKVVCTTFPVYQAARNVAQGSSSIELELMLPAQLGCPHDYSLSPQDMRKLAGADTLIVNGLGMEEFMGAPLRKANAALKIVDSSAGIKDTLNFSKEHDAEHHHGEHEAGHGHHHHNGINPHIFVSPRLYARQVMNIADGLKSLDPAGAAIYERNAAAYAARLRTLNDECEALGRVLANKRIVTQHGAFDYLARDMGLEIVAVVSGHGGVEPSAAHVLEIVKTVKHTHAGAIFTEPQYPDRLARMIAREAGIKAATLDPVASGPARAGLDYYETVMRRNMVTLKETLGTRKP